jgi:hypothetical protein
MLRVLQYVTLFSKVYEGIQPLFKSDIEGTFETGILAASWNPDESVVAIVTGAPFGSP